MLKQSLLGEFLHEAEKTRKLLQMIPDNALEYRPQPHLWSIAQLASHIAELYNWYDVTFNHDSMDMAAYKYDKGDITKGENILAKFEINVEAAKHAIEISDENNYMNDWKMVMGDSAPLFPPTPKIHVIREFLFNHLYHHRGELIAHIRASGNKVPSLYGNIYEDHQQQQ